MGHRPVSSWTEVTNGIALCMHREAQGSCWKCSSLHLDERPADIGCVLRATAGRHSICLSVLTLLVFLVATIVESSI